ncbi:MATE family efflux transporter [Spiroplasma endosymbiont of Crioceris asparagi]|uniref:MATE family efflux transporter n=1 Tax=Spiroplasma endosymbiont of Crioceris asparagi TaxID=3066286 RepID=UPI0030CDA00A
MFIDNQESLQNDPFQTTNINNPSKNKIRKRFFATKNWYKLAITLILWAVLQEIVSASTDIIDNIFVNFLKERQIDGLKDLNQQIEDSGWNNLSKDVLNGLQLFKYHAGQIAVNGVVASNQIFLIMFCTITGFCYGAGVYSAQYFGAEENAKLRNIVCLKLYVTVSIGVLVGMFRFIPGLPEALMKLTIDSHGNGAGHYIEKITNREQAQEFYWYIQNQVDQMSIKEGAMYFKSISWSYPILAINLTFISVLRETGRPKASFIMAVIALVSNFTGNAIFTLPNSILSGIIGIGYGVQGSGIGTGISRVFQLVFILLLLNFKKYEFIPRWASFKIPLGVWTKAMKKALPLVASEIMFSLGVVLQVKLKAKYSADSLTANAIFETVLTILFSPIYHGFSAGISVLVGNTLGKKKFEEANYNAEHLIKLSVMISVILMMMGFLMAYLVPNHLYTNASHEAKNIAFWTIAIYSFFYPIVIVDNSCYSIIRTGGKTLQAFLLDSIVTWCITLPVLSVLILYNTRVTNINSKFTISISIIWIQFIVFALESTKFFFAIYFYKRKKWLQSIV